MGILALDTEVLLFLNSFHNSFLDNLMWHYTQKATWFPLYLTLIVIVIYKWRKQSVWIIGALILCIGLSDIVSSAILKPLFERPRPSRVPELEGLLHLVNNYRGGRFGFVSSHAAISFGLASLFTLFNKKENLTAIILFLWATLNAYSRIYLGVHYPGDILGGILVGTSIAFLSYALVKYFKPHLLTKNISTSSTWLHYAVLVVWSITFLIITLL